MAMVGHTELAAVVYHVEGEVIALYRLLLSAVFVCCECCFLERRRKIFHCWRQALYWQQAPIWSDVFLDTTACMFSGF